MNWIIKVYKIAGKISIFNKIGSKIRSKKLIHALKFYNYYNESHTLITSNEVGAGTVLIFLFTFISCNLILFGFNYLISILISLIFALILSRKIYSYIINQFRFRYLNSLQFLDLVYQDFLIIINSTNSIFDAIDFIAHSNYPIISRNFKEMIRLINSGEKPEKILFKYVNSLPNQTFKERMVDLIDYDNKVAHISKKNQEFSIELSSKYQEYTKQLDTRMTILIGVNVFLPILTVITFSFYLSVNNYLIVLLLPFHVFLLLILKKTLLKREFFILGEKDFTSNEFDELILFLSAFANYLEMNNAPEISLIKAMKTHSEIIDGKLLKISSNIISKNYHIDKFWEDLVYNMENKQSKVLLHLVKRMLRKSSAETGTRLKNIIHNININKQYIEKRKVLLKSLQFKVLILLFVLGGLMGVMTNIIPFFSQFFLIMNNGSFTEIAFPQQDIFTLLPIAFTLGSILFITAKIITKAIKLRNSLFYSLIVLLVYLLIMYLIDFYLL